MALDLWALISLPLISIPSSTFLKMFRHGRSNSRWNMKPMSNLPCRLASPESGLSIPARILRRVVLPYPLGAIRVRISPCTMSRHRLSMIELRFPSIPNVFFRFFIPHSIWFIWFCSQRVFQAEMDTDQQGKMFALF